MEFLLVRAFPCTLSIFFHLCKIPTYSGAFNKRLGEKLKKSTNAELIDLSIEGKGVYGSFKELIQSNKQNIKGSIVIWEFPFRQIDEIVCASNPQSHIH